MAFLVIVALVALAFMALVLVAFSVTVELLAYHLASGCS